MNPRSRNIAIVAATAVLAAGAGIGVAASQGDSTANPSSTTPGMIRQGGPGGGCRFLSALAHQLGVSEARLQQAMQAARPAAGGPPDVANMAQALANELGLPVSKVQSALEATMPQSDPRAARARGRAPAE